MKSSKSAKVIVAFLCVAIFMIVIPGGSWFYPPQSIRIGPIDYRTQLSKHSDVVFEDASYLDSPTEISMSFQFRIVARPKDFSYLVSTARNDSGLRIALDLYGNLFVRLPVLKEAAGGYRVILIAQSLEFNKWMSLKVDIDLNLESINIGLNDIPIHIVEARPSQAIRIAEIELSNSYVEIGGSDNHNFDGEIKNFTLVSGTVDKSINLFSLKLFLGLLGLVVVVLVLVKREDLDSV